MVSFGWFAGCWIPLKMPYMEAADRKILSSFGIELRDLEGMGCCPEAQALLGMDRLTWLSLAARNLCVAEEAKLNILTPCPGCFETLKTANETLKASAEMKGKVNAILGKVDREYKGTVNVEHVIPLLYRQVGVEKISAQVKRPLKGLKVAVHYGCHLIRPSHILKVDDGERPVILDELVNATGATSIPYLRKMQCCGAPISFVNRNTSFQVMREKLLNIKNAGADCMVVACPSCLVQFDTNQTAAQEMFNETYQIPVLYYSELLALAMGITPKELGFTHRVPVDELLGRLEPLRVAVSAQ